MERTPCEVVETHMENTWYHGHSDRIYTVTGQGILRIVGSLHELGEAGKGLPSETSETV